MKFYQLANLLDLEYDGDVTDLRLHGTEILNWGAETEEEYNQVIESIDAISYEGDGWHVYAWYDVSGYDYWMIQQEEPNYINITVSFDSDEIDEDEIPNIQQAIDSAYEDAYSISEMHYYPRYKRGGSIDGRSTRSKNTWNRGSAWTRDRNAYNKNEDWEKPLNRRGSKDRRKSSSVRKSKSKNYMYVPNYMIRGAEVSNKGKNTDIDGANILDGIYVKAGTKFAGGGGVGKILVTEYNSQKDYENGNPSKEISFNNEKEARIYAYNRHYKDYVNLILYNLDTKERSYYGIDSGEKYDNYDVELDVSYAKGGGVDYLSKNDFKINFDHPYYNYEKEYQLASQFNYNDVKIKSAKGLIDEDGIDVEINFSNGMIMDIRQVGGGEIGELSNATLRSGVRDSYPYKTATLDFHYQLNKAESFIGAVKLVFEYLYNDVKIKFAGGGGVGVLKKFGFNLGILKNKYEKDEYIDTELLKKDGYNRVYYNGLISEWYNSENGNRLVYSTLPSYRDWKVGQSKSYSKILILSKNQSDITAYKEQIDYGRNLVHNKEDYDYALEQGHNFATGGGVGLKERSERDSIKLAKAYQKVLDSNFADKEYDNYQKMVKETQIPKEELQKLENYISTTPKGKQRMIDIYRYWGTKYAKGGRVKDYKYVPNYMIESVEVEKNGKTTEIDGDRILDGLYVKDKTKFNEGGGVGINVYDFDKKMALINLDIIHEYSVKLDNMVTEESQLEEWVKMKLTKVEQNVADVKHSLAGWEKFNKGGMIFKKQLLHISKYSKDLINMIQSGSKLMSWQENKLAISADYIDAIYHHMDYIYKRDIDKLDYYLRS